MPNKIFRHVYYVIFISIEGFLLKDKHENDD